MIEPVAYRFTENLGNGKTEFSYYSPEQLATAYRDNCLAIAPLYVISEGFALVPVEPTDEWITKMRAGTIEPQGMDAQAKIIQRLRDQYRKFITAAKGE